MYYIRFPIEICFLNVYNNYNSEVLLIFRNTRLGGMYNEGYYISCNGSRYGKQIWRS